MERTSDNEFTERNVKMFITPEAEALAHANYPVQFRNAIGYASLWGLGYPEVVISAWCEGDDAEDDERKVTISAMYVREGATKFFMRAFYYPDKADFAFHS